MKQQLLCISVLIANISYTQNLNIDIQEKEQLIKQTLASEPEQAKAYIQEILQYKGYLPDTVYANTYIAFGYYHNLKNNTDSSLYYYDKAASYTDKQKYPKIYARMLRNKAGTLKKRGQNEEALKVLAQAEEIYQSINDETGVAIVYGEIASNKNILLQNNEGIYYLLKAITILEKKNDKIHLPNVKLSLANAYLNSGNLNFAEDLYKDALQSFKEQNVVKNYSVTLLNYGDCLIRQRKYPEARQILKDAIPGLRKFNDQEIIGIVYSKLGSIEYEQKHYEAAEAYYQVAFQKTIEKNSLRTISVGSEYIRVLDNLEKYSLALEVIQQIETPEIVNKANVSDIMFFETQKGKIYEKLNLNDKALLSLENSLKLKDTLKKTENSAVVLKLQEQYQEAYQAKKNASLKNTNITLKEKLYQGRRSMLLALLYISIIVTIIVCSVILAIRKHRKKLIAAKLRKEKLLQDYEAVKKLNQLSKKELEDKKEELSSGIVSLTTLEGNISKLIALCKENPKNLCIEQLKGELQSLTSDKDYWALFRKRFSETYAGFQTNLENKFPSLTKNDLYFCALLKLNLPYKDMATLMQVSPETIVKKKYRVKKKMGIETETDLEKTLLDIPL